MRYDMLRHVFASELRAVARALGPRLDADRGVARVQRSAYSYALGAFFVLFDDMNVVVVERQHVGLLMTAIPDEAAHTMARAWARTYLAYANQQGML